MIEHDWIDHAFLDEYTVGFDQVAAHVKEWTPRRTAEVTGISERAIRQAAEMWGTAETSFLLHARGIDANIWTPDCHGEESVRVLERLISAGIDRITTNTAPAWVEAFRLRDGRSEAVAS